MTISNVQDALNLVEKRLPGTTSHLIRATEAKIAAIEHELVDKVAQLHFSSTLAQRSISDVQRVEAEINAADQALASLVGPPKTVTPPASNNVGQAATSTVVQSAQAGTIANSAALPQQQ